MFANCAHIIVSLLKAWKVAVVGIENSASKVANWIIVDSFKYLYYPRAQARRVK